MPPPDVAPLRRATRAAVVLAPAALVALGVLFGVVLDPAQPSRCTTGLYPGLYADVLVPAHLAAFVLVATLLARLSARRAGGVRPPRRTVVGLGVLAAFVGASLAWPPLLAWPGLVAMVVAVPVGGMLLIVAIVHSVATARAGLPAEERWRRHALVAELALWTVLVLALPAAFAAAWVNDAGLFCF